MQPDAIQGANIFLKPPQGQENKVEGLYARLDSDHLTMTSAWYPSREEIALLVLGQPVYLSVTGTNHPPVMLYVPEKGAE